MFNRIACDLVAKSPNIIDVEFVPMLAHVEPVKLNQQLQERINAVKESDRSYDAILLGFGLCGNSVIGLTSDLPMIIPRAHDCCTIHMGSKGNFLNAFEGNLSSGWGSTGYFERTFSQYSGYPITDQLANYKTTKEYIGYVEQYGEEDADYIWETMHPKIETGDSFYIKIDGYEYSNSYEGYLARAEETGKQMNVVNGSAGMLKALVNGDWNEDMFLIVGPGQKIAGVYDLDYVMKAE